jgi:formylglycine-generating enzyme required for sulfatase activity
MLLVAAACHVSGCRGRPARGSEAAVPADRKPYTEKIPGTDVAFEMVPVPAGRFVMGSPPGEPNRSKDEGPQCEVQLAPFWMGKCEVTWEEYELWALGHDEYFRTTPKAERTDRDRKADAVTRATPPYGDHAFGMGRDGRPAISMTQLAAKMYCKWLSAKTGRYYRLPTEAEWEYACRAGTRTAYSFGDDPNGLDDRAWHAGNSDEKYHPVGRKKPNPWGLHDMHGNVAEWVLDRYTADGYAAWAGKPVRCPLAVPSKIHPRVVRGGSWRDGAAVLRSAARRHSGAKWSAQDPQVPQSIWWHTDADFVGFRVVRPLRKPTAEEAKRYGLDKPQQAELKDDLDRREGE